MPLPFLRKKTPEVTVGKGFIPVERAKELAAKGFSEVESIDILRREGFSASEIDKALTQALRIGITEEKSMESPPQTFQPLEPEPRPKLPTFEEIRPTMPAVPSMPEPTLPEEYYQSYPTEEYVDYVVQERMAGLDQRFDEFSRRNAELERRVGDIIERLTEMSRGKTEQSELLISKIESFKESIQDVDIRIGSLEKAFKDTLPALIESVRALTSLVQRFKKEG